MSQSFFTSSSNSIHFLKGFLLALALLLLPTVLLSLYLEPLHGDLTRIGHLAERDFGAREAQQPQRRLANLKASDMESVLVLGDSFSAENLWQSMLTNHSGLKTKTYHYKDILCTSNWLDKATQGKVSASAHIIIIETVEREFIPRFGSDTKACINGISPPLAIDEGSISGSRPKLTIFPIDPRHLMKAWLNHLHEQPGRVHFNGNRVIKTDLIRQDLFSSRHPERLLYFGSDDRKSITWSAARARYAMATLRRHQEQARKNRIKLFIVVIPDKSSVYSKWIAPGQHTPVPKYDLFEQLEVTFGSHANYLAPFRQKAAITKDFYAPDDTHLSLDGFRYLAELLERQIQIE